MTGPNPNLLRLESIIAFAEKLDTCNGNRPSAIRVDVGFETSLPLMEVAARRAPGALLFGDPLTDHSALLPDARSNLRVRGGFDDSKADT
jgi:hypothetical protein